MKIIGIDLGKFNSVACIDRGDDTKPSFQKLPTDPAAFHDFLVDQAPGHLAIEVGGPAGWVHDLAVDLKIPCDVANTRDERWRWNRVKVKTDRTDALKLVRLTRMGELPTVTVPKREVRQHKQLIRHRETLVARRTAINNHVRALFDQQGIKLPAGQKLWSKAGRAMLAEHARPMTEDLPLGESWRGVLHLELAAWEALRLQLKQIEARLEARNAECPRTRRLQTIPGVGPRLAESLVTVIGDPKRFKSAKEVAAYVGLTPRLHQSGEMMRDGRISKQGDRRLRSLLVEIAWACRRFNPAFRALFERLTKGDPKRKKKAAVALARRILTVCWSMLRHETDWDASRVGVAVAVA